MAYMFWSAQEAQKQQELAALQAPVATEAPADIVDPDGAVATPASSETVEASPMLDLLAKDVESATETLAPALSPVPEETVTIANDFIEVEFTNKGGAIRHVYFLKTKRGGQDDFVFNEDGHLPALSLGLAKGDGGIQEFDLPYTVESKTTSSITFVLQAGPDLKIRRTYSITQGESEEDPYIIKHSTSFDNQAATAKAFSTVYLNLGTMRPLAEGRMAQSYLNVGYYDGNDAEFKPITKLTGSKGVLGIGASSPKDQLEIEGERFEWTSVKNQFFTGVLSADGDESGHDLVIYPVNGSAQKGITGSVGYKLGTVPAGGSQALDFTYYVGPKEFKRLQALGNAKDEVMQFGFLSFISKLLLSFMYLIHSVVPNWGVSIIIMTICIKLLFWPLTAQASRSQKRMASIQGPMAELKEKYKDNPQKMQQETLKLFRENQVNPVAGCLPMLVQMPIFLGLFYMLRSASELRFERFLWVSDLSQPDTLFEVAGFPINILPLIMGVTMFLQMSMMPMNPSADPAQQKIFKFLPFVFLIFLYNFSSGLVLYWTMQNILTIVQQKITNSRPDPVPATAPVSGKGHAARAAKAKPAKKK